MALKALGALPRPTLPSRVIEPKCSVSACAFSWLPPLTRSTLFLFNLIDGLAGVGLVSYSIYLRSSVTTSQAQDELSWTYMLVAALGTCLLLTSLLSVCGLSFDSCRCSLCLSAWLAIPVAALELISLIVFGAMKKNAISFLEGHREQLGLSQQALDTFEGMYVAFMYFLAGLLVLELLRFHLSKHLRQEIDVSLEEYRERLLDQRYIHERRASALRSNIQSKYEDMRGKYIRKYHKAKTAEDGSDDKEGSGFIDV